MSMFHSRPAIEAGDLVIIFMSRDNMTAITVTPGQFFHNKFGKYKHDDMIGMKFGSKMHSPPPQSGYIHLLRPTPELWTVSLPHRTQILYMPDIAYIMMRLGVRVGGKVIEAGTGSGSMTHSLSRTVGARGTVYSFEYHQTRYEKAGEEFSDHGLDNITLQHRNVCRDGFGELNDVEAIFLDLPAPWEAIPHTVKVMNPEVITRICCFSPCLEQVLKTATALRAEGFTEVSTQEVLVRTYDLVAPPPSGSHHLMDVTSIAASLKEHERRKEERRVTQMRNAREKSRLAKAAEVVAKAVAQAAATAGSADAVETGVEAGEKRKEREEAPEGTAAKKARVQGPESVEVSAVKVEASDETMEDETKVDEEAMEDDSEEPEPKSSEPEVPWSSMVLTKPSPEMRGHTSYLTFATFYPASVRAQQTAQETAPPTRAPTGPATPVGETATSA